MVREAAGGIAANRGQVSSLDRRLEELTGQGSDQTAADLAALRSELDALRGFMADQPSRPGPITAAASDPLRETITELAGRIDMLGEVVRSTSGRMVGEQNRTSELADALAEQDARAEARFLEIQRRLEAVSEQAEQALKTPAQPPDAALEARVTSKVDVLVDRVNFLAETATATAGRVAATDGELATFQQRSSEALTKLERRSEEALARTEGALESMRGDLKTFKTKLDVDPMLSERMSSLLNSVEALGSRVGTLSGIVSETAGRVAGREIEIAGLDSRIDDVSIRIESVAIQLRSEIDAITAAPADAPSTGAEADARTEALDSHLALLESTLEDTAGATEQLGQICVMRSRRSRQLSRRSTTRSSRRRGRSKSAESPWRQGWTPSRHSPHRRLREGRRKWKHLPRRLSGDTPRSSRSRRNGKPAVRISSVGWTT